MFDERKQFITSLLLKMLSFFRGFNFCLTNQALVSVKNVFYLPILTKYSEAKIDTAYVRGGQTFLVTVLATQTVVF